MEAFRGAEEEAADRLEAALWLVAMPHQAEKVTTELLRDRNGDPLKHPVTGEDWYAVTQIVRSTEYDTAAMIALLKARRPDKYRERHDVRHSGTITSVSMTEWDDAIRDAIARMDAYQPPELPPGVTPALPESNMDRLSDTQQ